ARADRAQISLGKPGGAAVLRGVGHGDLLAPLAGLEQLRTFGAADVAARGMAVALLVLAVEAGDAALAMVELPQADAPRGKGAGHRLGEAAERIPIARVEQGSGRGQLVEGC